MSAKKSKNKTLSEKISESFIPKALPDPERDSDDETAAKLADVDEDEIVVNNKLSDFRKRNVKLLSEFGEKYRGKVTSRADFMEDDSGGSEEVSEDEESSEEDDGALEQYRKELMASKVNEKERKTSGDSEDSGGEDLMDSEEDASDDNEDVVSEEDVEDDDEEGSEEVEEDDEEGSEEVEEDDEDDESALQQYRKELMGSKVNGKAKKNTVPRESLMDDANEEDDEDGSEKVEEDDEEGSEEVEEYDEEGSEEVEENDEEGSEDDESAFQLYRKELMGSKVNGKVKKNTVDREDLMNDATEEDDDEDGVSDEEEENDEEEEEDEDDDEVESQLENEGQQKSEVRTKLVKQTDKKEEIRKGFAVQSQLKLWEKFLEVRIHSQKMLIKANSLPVPKELQVLCEEDNDLENLRKETQQNVCNLLNGLLEVKHSLLNQFCDTKDLAKKLRKRPSNANSDEPPIKFYAAELQENMENFRPYRNTVLLKWNDRTKVLTPGAASKRNKSLSDNFDILKKIDAVLLNKSDLKKKSQIVKGTYTLFGCDPEKKEGESQENETQTEMSSAEIYDDTDFYHQLLRELIEFKTNTSATPAEMSKQFAELQKLRQKMKKKVDTRASKGRKIRYVVHNKLVNFMAPNPYTRWTEDSKTELYRSLFGS